MCIRDRHNKEDLTKEIKIDSASFKYVKTFIEEERERIKSSEENVVRIKSFDSSYIPPVFTYQYLLDNDSLPADVFFQEVDIGNIKHFTKTMDWVEIKEDIQDEETTVFSENGDVIKQRFNIITKIKAYSNKFVDANQFDIDHVDLHYSKHNVLYLSLGSSMTGAMNTQIYDCNSGGQITSFGDVAYDGSYYIGNGIIKNINNLKYDNLNDINKLRAVIMIDDKFCFREFETKDIIEEQKEVSTL